MKLAKELTFFNNNMNFYFAIANIKDGDSWQFIRNILNIAKISCRDFYINLQKGI